MRIYLRDLRYTVRIMRKHSLDYLFPKTRQMLLGVLLGDTERSWYLSDLAKWLSATPSSLQRELAGLMNAGILTCRRDGNRIYYQADLNCPFLTELRCLLRKTAGLGDVLRDAIVPFRDRIQFAFVYGSVARGEENSASDIDIMIIGDISLAMLSEPLRSIEKQLGRSTNASVFTLDDFSQKLRVGNHFIRSITKSDKIWLEGNDNALGAACCRP